MEICGEIGEDKWDWERDRFTVGVNAVPKLTGKI
jgi:hypothetical protein